MATRARVYNLQRYPMAELDATFDRAWLLNDVGECEFTLSIRDPKARRDFLEFGTYILIEHDKLPVWVGVIDPPRRWSGDQTITVTAYSAEYLFSWRHADEVQTLTGTAGELFSKIVTLANKPEDLAIRHGEIFKGGPTREESIEEADFLADIKRIIERSGNDWSMEPAFDDAGRLYLRANWHYMRGVFRNDLTLQEGINLELPTGDLLYEQGTIINRITGLGRSAKEKDKLRRVETNEDSRIRFRLRTKSKQFEDKDAGTLKTNTMEMLSASAFPERVFPLYLLDVGNAFTVRVGDILPLHLYSVGFYEGGGFGVLAYVRVVGMRLEEDNGRLEVYVKEVTV